MKPDKDGKPEPIDPETAMRMVELEMMQQRAAREKTGKAYQGLRMISFLFLAIVVLGALFAFFYLFTSGKLDEVRSHANQELSPTPATATTH
jgi:hypothetical protein